MQFGSLQLRCTHGTKRTNLHSSSVHFVRSVCATQLRSRGVNILHNSATVLNFSKCAFSHASLTVWNSLPQAVISDLTVTTGTCKIGLNLLCAVVLPAVTRHFPTLAILHF